MSGHGHVVPNANGLKARCGGPAICSVCALELVEEHAAAWMHVGAADPRLVLDPALSIHLERARAATRQLSDLLRAFRCPAPRPDATAVNAVPLLVGKKAVVLYFETELDRDELVALIHEAKPNMRAVNL